MVDLYWRQRRVPMRPLTLILDISGSMADYSRALLQFAYSAKRASEGAYKGASQKVEVFCFGTASPASPSRSRRGARRRLWHRPRRSFPIVRVEAISEDEDA